MVDGMLTMRDNIPIQFEPPPGGEKGWAYLAVLLLNVEERMPPSALSVLGTLIDHANPKTGQCNPSVTRICAGTGLARRSAYRALSELQKSELVTNLARNHNGARRRRGNAYQINWSALVDAITIYKEALGQACHLTDASVTAQKRFTDANAMGDSKLAPTGDSKLAPVMVTAVGTLNLKGETKRETNTPKVAHLAVSSTPISPKAAPKSTDTETLRRLLAKQR